MTDEEIRSHVETINGMSQLEMATLRRYAPIGHSYFDKRLPLWTVFEQRFRDLGGMTPQISKMIDS